jgi:hypothetical protein
MVVLDKILINVQWDAKYPLAKVDMLPKGVSDHNPIRIEFGGRIERGIIFSDLRSGSSRWKGLRIWLKNIGVSWHGSC